MRVWVKTNLTLLAVIASGCATPSRPEWRPPTEAVKAKVAEITEVLRENRVATVHFTDGVSQVSVGFHFNSGDLCFADLTGHFVSCAPYERIASVTPGVDARAVAPLAGMKPTAIHTAMPDEATARGRAMVAQAVRAPDGAIVLAFRDGTEFAAFVGTPQDTRMCFRAVAMRQGGGQWIELDDGRAPAGLDLFCERYSSMASAGAGWPEEIREAIGVRPIMRAQDGVRYDPPPRARAWKLGVEAREKENFMRLFRAAAAKGDPVLTLTLGDTRQIVTDISWQGERPCYRIVVQTNDDGEWLDERDFADNRAICWGPYYWIDQIAAGDVRKR